MNDEIRNKIETLLDQHRVMTIATLRPDGWPQATTVGYVSEGLTLYFLCGLESQKAANLARDDRVSLTIDHDTPQVMEITGLSMAARAQAVANRAEAEKVLRMLPLKYPEQVSLPGPMPTPEQVRIFPRDAYGHLRARLLQGLWPHRSRHLLSALLPQTTFGLCGRGRQRLCIQTWRADDLPIRWFFERILALLVICSLR